MNGLLGKRFIFGCIAIISVSAVSWHLKFPPETYVTLVSSIVGMFMVSQSATDLKENGGAK